MLVKLFASAVLLFASVVYAQNATPPAGTLSQQATAPQDVLAVFPAITSPTNTPNVSLVGNPLKPGGVAPGLAFVYAPKYHTIQAFVSGAPTTCAYRVYGTLKLPVENPAFPADYQDLSGALDCTLPAGQMVSIYYKPVAGIVIALSALSGGSFPAVSFRFLGVH